MKKVWTAPEVLSTASAKDAAIGGYQKAPFTTEVYTSTGPNS